MIGNISDYLDCMFSGYFQDKFMTSCKESDFILLSELLVLGVSSLKIARPTHRKNNKMYVLTQDAYQRYTKERSEFMENVTERLIKIGTGE